MPIGCALVIGAPGGALHGVEQDACAMAALLQARGFAVDLRVGATRASILEGYQALISASVCDAPAVFYFAGHGFRGQLGNGSGATWQGISPVDIHESTTDDFRGITSCELSILQKQLTERTRNVTTILDCCYASQMSRVLVEAGAVRALPHPYRVGLSAHVKALRTRYGAVVDLVDPLGNPDAVRVMACGASECASEARWPNGTSGGAFTIALTELLHEIGHAEMTWAMLGEALRHRVQRQWVTQRPEVQGPINRQLFSLREVHHAGISATLAGNGVWLHAGRIAGVTVGNVYELLPLGADRYRSDAVRSTAVIRTVRAMSSEGEMTASSSIGSRDTLAFLIERATVPRAVAITGTAEEVGMLAVAIAKMPGLLPANDSTPDVLAHVHVAASEITISNACGRVCVPFAFPLQIENAVAQLAQLATAQDVRELEGAHGVRDDEVEVSWGTIANGKMLSLPLHGHTLGMAERPYIRVGCRSSRRLYAHVLGVGLRGEIAVLTSDAPSGVELRSDRPDFILGQGPDGKLRGMSLVWSEGVPRDAGPRLDELIVVIATVRGDLRTLKSSGGARARLHGALECRGASTRNMSNVDDAIWIGRISFALDPDVDFVAKDEQ